MRSSLIFSAVSICFDSLLNEFSTAEILVKDELEVSQFEEVKFSVEGIIESTKDFAKSCMSESFPTLSTLLLFSNPVLDFSVFLIVLLAISGSLADCFGSCILISVLLLLNELSVVDETLDV